MPDVISASIVFPLLNFAWRSLQSGYELAGVPAATTDHLKTISQVLLDIETARKLRNQTACYLSDDDVKNVDIVIKNTEEALAGLEGLVERARVDMQLGGGTVSAPARIMWVMRDSGKANAALTRLSLTSQSLLSQVSMMRQAQSTSSFNAPYRRSMSATAPLSLSNYGMLSSPHLLETTKALSERREWMQRRYSVKSSGSTPSHARQTPVNPAPWEDNDAFFNVRQNVADWIRDNESVLSDMDPDVYAGPRSELIHARVVENSDQDYGYPDAYAELEADSVVLPTSLSYQYPATGSSLPYLPPSGQETQPESQVSRPTYPPLPIANQIALDVTISHRRPPGSYSPFRDGNETRNATNARFATTSIPGRRGERLLTWEEPLDEEQEPASQDTIARERFVDNPPPYTSVTVPTAQPPSANIPPVAGLQGRRRPRVYNFGNTQTIPQPEALPVPPVPIGDGITARSGTVRSHRSRPSRSEWAFTQHEAESASISRGANIR